MLFALLDMLLAPSCGLSLLEVSVYRPLTQGNHLLTLD